ncbi:Na(+)/citrate cotransporter-like [Gordionus sp. m RMFG-2023]|uniref:Na(+)/citrate cotransporter-like n=1 Tax=Gordionus sp. m RMFG-2023 TaxID=3053472 RepID=UPI0031FD8CCE
MSLMIKKIIHLFSSQEIKCAYVCLVTIAFLITQALPLALSSLIPALLFPMVSVLTVKEVSSVYFKDPILLFFASVILAKGIQSANLHKRIALNLLMYSGSKPIWMVSGFIMSTFFISIWINNSATAVLMAPVAIGVMEEYNKFKKVSVVNKVIAISSKHELFNEKENEQTRVIINDIKDKEDLSDSNSSLSKNDDELQNLHKCIFIGIAYACNIGGTASLTGTPPNLIMTGFLNVETFRQMGNKKFKDDPRSFIREQLKGLGKIRQNEITILCLFVTLVGLWVLKDPRFISGWQVYFEKKYVSDATPALLMAFLLFILPTDFRSVLFIKDDNGEIPDYQPLLIWRDIYRDLMWDINLLLGGGLAMADGFEKSGLSKLLVKYLDVFRLFPKQLLGLTFSILTSCVTEMLNNIATASILLPIISEIALNIKVNPIYFMFPATLSASYCFMLPIGTAPNAIIYSAGKLKFFDMVKPGIVVHLICIVVTYVFINSYGILVLKVNEFPDWAISNKTKLSNFTTFENKLGEIGHQQAVIRIQPNALPIDLPARKVPIPLRQAVKAELVRLLDEGVIEKVI